MGVFRSVLRLRLKLWFRRHGNLLNLVLGAGALWLCFYLGQRFGAARLDAVGGAGLAVELGALLPLVWLPCLLLSCSSHERRLCSAADNHLLLILPVGAGSLALVQLVEGLFLGLGFAAGAGAFWWGTSAGADLLRGLLAALGAGLALAGLAPLLAVGLARLRLRSRGFPWGLLLYPLGFVGVVAVLRQSLAMDALWSRLAQGWAQASWGLAWPTFVWGPAASWTAVGLCYALAGLAGVASVLAMRAQRAELVSQALAADTSPRGRLWAVLRRLLAFLPTRFATLLRRDLVLLGGKGYARVRWAGLLMLAVYPVYHQLVRGISHELGQELVSSSHAVFLACFASYFFCLDFWKFKARGFALERAHPVPGSTALWASLAIAAPPAVILGLLLVPLAGPLELSQWSAWGLGLKGALLAAMLSHFFAAFSLENYRGTQIRGESALAISAGVFGFVLALGLRIHPLLALAYPLLVRTSVRRAKRNYERVVVDWEEAE